MKKHLMPPDEGLKEPVRKFKDTFSGETLVLEMLKPQIRNPKETLSAFTVLKNRFFNGRNET